MYRVPKKAIIKCDFTIGWKNPRDVVVWNLLQSDEVERLMENYYRDKLDLSRSSSGFLEVNDSSGYSLPQVLEIEMAENCFIICHISKRWTGWRVDLELDRLEFRDVFP